MKSNEPSPKNCKKKIKKKKSEKETKRKLESGIPLNCTRRIYCQQSSMAI